MIIIIIIIIIISIIGIDHITTPPTGTPSDSYKGTKDSYKGTIGYLSISIRGL